MKRKKKRFRIKPMTLEQQLCELLLPFAGERGHSEGAADCLARIINERKLAFNKLALIAIQEQFFIRSL